MTEGSSIPRAWIEGCVAAHRRLEDEIRSLSDEDACRDSLLPDWSVGHVLTHLARNADSHRGMFEGAQRGQMVAQYPGGMEQRDAEIAAGCRRPAAELVADVEQSNRALERAWESTNRETWATGLGRRAAGLTAIADLPRLRWREVEVHRVDLPLSGSANEAWDTLSPSYIDAEWGYMLARLDGRVPEGISLLLVAADRPSRVFGHGDQIVTVRSSSGRILRWLFGRGGDPSWPELRPWSSVR